MSITHVNGSSLSEAQRLQAEAREEWLRAHRDGRDLTGAELGKRFGRSDRWGQQAIKEARQILDTEPPAEPATEAKPAPERLPGEVELIGLPDGISPSSVTSLQAKPEAKPAEPEAQKLNEYPTEHLTINSGIHSLPSPGETEAKEAKPDRSPVEVKPQKIHTGIEDVEATTSPTEVDNPAEAKASSAAPPPIVEQAQPPAKGSRFIAWTALGLGIAASVAANIGHMVYVTGPHMKGGINVGSIIGAAWWPISLALAIEVITRVNWPNGWGYALARFAGVGAVAAVAAWVSYWHMEGLLTFWGEDKVSAHVGPLGVDGLVIVGGFALMALSHSGSQPAKAEKIKKIKAKKEQVK